ncbi:Hypp6831 [Branchiostoma lanceolatum]|uniref:Hypp6831 protein n=1 Tax=Branchiostoma lanceolatum TaxID=7740 RepID=A0A8K0EB74_BRALA|nr:Hypp6831 [Branchiostoma lanceolatum]
MSPHVSLQITQFTELPAALLTPVGFLTGADEPVVRFRYGIDGRPQNKNNIICAVIACITPTRRVEEAVRLRREERQARTMGSYPGRCRDGGRIGKTRVVTLQKEGTLEGSGASRVNKIENDLGATAGEEADGRDDKNVVAAQNNLAVYYHGGLSLGPAGRSASGARRPPAGHLFLRPPPVEGDERTLRKLKWDLEDRETVLRQIGVGIDRVHIRLLKRRDASRMTDCTGAYGRTTRHHKKTITPVKQEFDLVRTWLSLFPKHDPSIVPWPMEAEELPIRCDRILQELDTSKQSNITYKRNINMLKKELKQKEDKVRLRREERQARTMGSYPGRCRDGGRIGKTRVVTLQKEGTLEGSGASRVNKIENDLGATAGEEADGRDDKNVVAAQNNLAVYYDQASGQVRLGGAPSTSRAPVPPTTAGYTHARKICQRLWNVESRDKWNRQGQKEIWRLLQRLDGSTNHPKLCQLIELPHDDLCRLIMQGSVPPYTEPDFDFDAGANAGADVEGDLSALCDFEELRTARAQLSQKRRGLARVRQQLVAERGGYATRPFQDIHRLLTEDFGGHPDGIIVIPFPGFPPEGGRDFDFAAAIANLEDSVDHLRYRVSEER